MNYDVLLLEIRKAALLAGDSRSLVAIAAEFERNGIERLRGILTIAESRSHNRNTLGDVSPAVWEAILQVRKERNA